MRVCMRAYPHVYALAPHLLNGSLDDHRLANAVQVGCPAVLHAGIGDRGAPLRLDAAAPATPAPEQGRKWEALLRARPREVKLGHILRLHVRDRVRQDV